MIGSRISHYDVIETIGKGGMGVVYRAADVRLGRTVALKFLADHLLTEGNARERFMHEARAVAAINHTNIATLYDVGEEDGKLFLAMEFVEGDDLRHHIKQTAISVEDALEYATKIALGLERAHEAGIVHRDIKPANVVITHRNEVKILDFGVAKITDYGDLSQPGTVLGTSAYMSPEQISGNEVDRRTDLWALGVVLYEMLTGRRPFEAEYQHALYYSIVNSDYPPVSSWVPELGTRFDDVLSRLLTKQPSNRYNNAHAVVEDLSQLRDTAGAISEASSGKVQHDKIKRDTHMQSDGPGTSASMVYSRSRSAAASEKRQITEIHCEIVGYGDLTASEDLEDLMEMTDEYRSIWETQVHRYGGLAGPYTGGSLNACFGYPIATESDVRKAIRCGLAVRRLVASTAKRAGVSGQPQLKIGIHTGIAIVGSDHGHYQVQGNIGEVALKIAGHAEAGAVLVSDATHKLGYGFFDFVNHGINPVPGFSRPINLFEVSQESSARTRLEFVAAADLSPLVGRDAELAMLRKRWRQVQSGEGSSILISGEAGLGKSRIADSFIHEVVDSGTGWSGNVYCSSFKTGSALHPFVDFLKQNVWAEHSSEVVGGFDEMASYFREAGLTVETDIGLMADLLDVPMPDELTQPKLAPAERQRRTMMALLQMITLRSEEQPGIFVIEDLHWADPSTIHWLELLVSQTPTKSLLVLATSRPEFRPSWVGKARTAEITLDKLDAEDLVTISEHRSGKKLPQEILDQIIQRTDGVPLFTEELTNMILESGILVDHGDRYELVGPIPNHTIPTTLHGSLIARLDRLHAEKEIAQLGAVLGREFSFEIIHAVSGIDEESLTVQLSKLVESELIYERGFAPDSTYIFKHALIQDTAYNSMLKSRRRQLHAQVAEVLVNRSDAAEVIARHFTEAGQAEKAIHYWTLAGRDAMRANANREAVDLLATGLSLVPSLPEGSKTDLVELGILNLLGPATNMTRGHWDPEGEKILSRATELCERVQALEPLAMALQGLSSTYLIRGDYARGFDAAKRIETAAKESGSAEFSVMAHSILSSACLFTGQLEEAIAHTDVVTDQYDPEKHGRFALLGWGTLDVTSRLYKNLACHLTGFPDDSLAAAIREHENSRDAEYHFDFYMTSIFLGMQYLARKEWRAAQAALADYLSEGQKYGDPFSITISTILHNLSLRGPDNEEAFRSSKVMMDHIHQVGYGIGYSFQLAHFAQGLMHYGDLESVGPVLDEAIAHLARSGSEFWQPEVHRLQGELAQFLGNPEADAEQHFFKAIKVARSQHSRMLELRATTSLTQLYGAPSKNGGDKALAARAQLKGAYSWFSQGFDCDDLVEARNVLEEFPIL